MSVKSTLLLVIVVFCFAACQKDQSDTPPPITTTTTTITQTQTEDRLLRGYVMNTFHQTSPSYRDSVLIIWANGKIASLQIYSFQKIPGLPEKFSGISSRIFNRTGDRVIYKENDTLTLDQNMYVLEHRTVTMSGCENVAYMVYRYDYNAAGEVTRCTTRRLEENGDTSSYWQDYFYINGDFHGPVIMPVGGGTKYVYTSQRTPSLYMTPDEIMMGGARIFHSTHLLDRTEFGSSSSTIKYVTDSMGQVVSSAQGNTEIRYWYAR